MGETDKQPIRILHVLGTLNLGGAESFTEALVTAAEGVHA